ncbi:hypothetical protein DCAR_0520027 [Daucus carota subsp. sativus]|uniref:Uncharacterized protein n=1 Tax=Daucus carota subsp. sativus TaxID=79200 RepID=A0AAF0X5F9_DAUCS|nr:hypothetical protein DCAR_0520027 [Daucus carota subsp. sativus]
MNFQAETNGKDPTPADVYLLTHTKNRDKKTFVTKKAEAVYVIEIREERSKPVEGSEEPQIIDEDEIFLQAVGGLDKRNRIYGMGSLQSVIYGPESRSDTSTSRYSGSNFNREYELMQVELQEMKDQVKELQEMRNTELEDMRKQMEEMKSQLALVFRNQNAS